jgi:hypothetical protein
MNLAPGRKTWRSRKSFPAFSFLKESKAIWQLRSKVRATPETPLGAKKDGVSIYDV